MSLFKKNKFKGEGRTVSEAKVAPAPAAPAPKQDASICSVKFEIRIKDKVHRIDSKFAVQQKLSSLYTYLEQEVLSDVQGLEIIQAFPRAVIPRDDTKALASMGIRGQVMLQVTFTSGKLRH